MKMKKLLAAALAATMVISSMVSTFVASAATTLYGSIAASDETVEVGDTTVKVPVKISFTDADGNASATTSPHGMFTITIADATLTEVAVVDYDNANTKGEPTLADGSPALTKCVSIDTDGANLEKGIVLVESLTDDYAPIVTYIDVECTFTIPAAEYGKDLDVDISDIQATDLSESDWTGITAGGAKITVDCVDHDYGEGVIDPDATCTEEGVKTFTCSICEHSYTEAISAKGHTAGDPVDNEDGTHTVSCSVCTAVIETVEHTYVDGACACGAVEEVACEHTDANQDGICDTCAHENLDESLAFYNKAMVLGADIRGIYQVRKMKATSPYESFKVIVEKTDGTVSELELVATSDKTNYTTYGYAITVAAKEMADSMNARIVGITAEGEAFISNIDTWSIKQGLISNMDGASTGDLTDAKLNTLKLAANMLNYGAEAQKNFSYNLDNLATDGLSEEYAAYIITETPEMAEIPATDDTGATAPLKDIMFNLAARVQILPRFTVAKADAKEDYSAVITQVHTAPDGTVTTKEFTIDGADCLKSSTTFAVYVDNLASNELRDVLTVTLYKNGEAVSATHTFSAESVLVGKLETNATLVTALMNYGDCARAYFG